MAICVEISPDHGNVLYATTELDGASSCSAYVLVSSSEYDSLLTHKSLTPLDVSAAVGFGFTVVFGLGYLSTYGVALAKRLIKLI
ncbi:single-stranded DNA-binding protein [Vibrio intestinalis]|uniref:single-stranded DNA-binding protein n=1 Tax=Vibrio intestinalis TaxID=2933291 RepID=UPI0021A40273|nr:single-stranded DNA-binding protein [Vibrio intestinalis]